MKINKLIDKFIKESNMIEGITSYHAEDLFKLHVAFFDLPSITLADICNFVNRVAGHTAVLRDQVGLNVTVGDHKPMLGGPRLRAVLQTQVEDINWCRYSPFDLHNRFAHLHPFMDGNGRTARAIWARQMVMYYGYDFKQSFLHTYYYQALSSADKNIQL